MQKDPQEQLIHADKSRYALPTSAPTTATAMSILQHHSEARKQTASNHNESVPTAKLEGGTSILVGLTRGSGSGRRTRNAVKDLVGRRRGRRGARGLRA